MEVIRKFEKINKNDVSLAGGKGASLGEMTQAGIPIPPGFVVLSEVFESFIKNTGLNVEIDAALDTVNQEEMHTIENASEKIQALITSSEMPKDIEKEILQHFKALDSKYVAVRSSATAEDSASAAWAGQLDTFLNTTQDSLIENVKKCWASLFTPRAIFYRFEKNLHNTKISVAVVIQKMINSESSGIAFSVHPVTQDRNQLIIEAAFGLGEAIVSGSITPDSYIIDKQDWHIIDIGVNEQNKGLFRKENGRNEWQTLSNEEANKQVLDEKEIIELSKLIIKIENHYGFPVDIEWAREKGKFYITQSRPITTLTNSTPDVKKNVVEKFIKTLGNDKLFVFEARFLPILVMVDWFHYYDSQGNLKSLYPILGYRGPTIDKGVISLAKYSESSIQTFQGYLDGKMTIEQINKNYKKAKKKIETLYENYYNTKTNHLQTLKETDDGLREMVARTLFLDVLDTAIIKEVLNTNKIEVDLKKLLKISQTLEFPSFETKNNEAIIRNLESKKDIMELQYIYTNYTAVPTREEIEQVLSKININELKDLIKKQKEELKQNSKKKKELTKNLSEIERKVLKFINWSTELRDDRKIAINKADALIVNLTKDLFEEWNLDKNLAPLAFVPEILKGKEYIENKIEDIKKRERGFAIIHHGGDFYEESEENVGNSIKKLDQIVIDQNAKGESSNNLLIGESASPGHAQGKVKVILSTNEFEKFQEGDILVAPMTRPEFVPLMKKAAAIITDEGGITSHAAIVSRELRKPCVIGTRIATKILKDGMEVQVNATHGVVKILKKANP